MSHTLKRGVTLGLVTLMLTTMSTQAGAFPAHGTYYGGADGYCGQITASGSVFDCGGFTAAHPNLPLGSQAEVWYEGNYVVVTITDRCGGCEIDLSPAAADFIGLLFDGSGLVEVIPL